VSGQLHAPAALPPGKSPRYPFYRRLDGPQSRSERYGEVKIFYPTGTRTPAAPGRPTRLSYPGSLTSYVQEQIYRCLYLLPLYFCLSSVITIWQWTLLTPEKYYHDHCRFSWNVMWWQIFDVLCYIFRIIFCTVENFGGGAKSIFLFEFMNINILMPTALL
jgi:hypothetical protein